MASRDVAHALGTLIDAALEREDVRRVSSVYYEGKRTCIAVEHASAAFEDTIIGFTTRQVRNKNNEELEEWADRLLARTLGATDDEEEDPEEEDDDEDEEEDEEEDD